MDLTFLDLETTGLSWANDRIVQISLIHIHMGQVSKFISFVRPDKPINPQATLVTGITDEMVAAALPWADIWIQIKEWMKTSLTSSPATNPFHVLVAQNGMAFDFPLLTTEIQRLPIDNSQFWMKDLYVTHLCDSLLLFKQYYKEQQAKPNKMKLSTVYEFLFQKPIVDCHSAHGDTQALYEIFDKIGWLKNKEFFYQASLSLSSSFIVSSKLYLDCSFPNKVRKYTLSRLSSSSSPSFSFHATRKKKKRTIKPKTAINSSSNHETSHQTETGETLQIKFKCIDETHFILVPEVSNTPSSLEESQHQNDLTTQTTNNNDITTVHNTTTRNTEKETRSEEKNNTEST